MTQTINEQLAAAEQHAAELRAKAAADQAAAQQRAEDACTAFDRDFLTRYEQERQAAVDEQQQAHKAFDAAVLADPLCAAYIRWRAARIRVRAVQQDAFNIANRIGHADFIGEPQQWRFPEILDALVPVLEKQAGVLGMADSERRTDDRTEVEQNARQG